MFRQLALSALLLLFVGGYVHGWERPWHDSSHESSSSEKSHEEHKEVHEDYHDVIGHIVHIISEAVSHGDLEEHHAWDLIKHFKYKIHCLLEKKKEENYDRSWSSEDKKREEDPECKEEEEDDHKAERDAEMEKDKYRKALEKLSKALKRDGASERYRIDEWKGLVKDMLFDFINSKDPLIDMSHEATLKISAKFEAPEKEIEVCYAKLRLDDVHKEVEFEGEEIKAAYTRYMPHLEITDLNGERPPDGLYTLIWADRAPDWEVMGNEEKPFIAWMVINTPACDPENGEVVKEYRPTGVSENLQVFVYEQEDRICDDFAIGDYTCGDECPHENRCFFDQAEFVDHYHLHQRAVGHIKVKPDPFTAAMGLYEGMLRDDQACSMLLDWILPTMIKKKLSDPIEENDLKEVLKKLMSYYVSEEDMYNEDIMRLWKMEMESLTNLLVNKYEADVLIPNYVEFKYDIGLWFHAKPDSTKMCGMVFDLEDVNKKVWLDKWEDGRRADMCSAGVREAPQFKLRSREREGEGSESSEEHKDKKEKLFTLIIADRSDFGEKAAHIVSRNRPYINWLVVNIKGDDIESGHEIVDYRPWPESKEQYVFVYEQVYECMVPMPMMQYTEDKCKSVNRCAFKQERFVWDWDLKLVAAGRYEIHKDVYGMNYQVRRGKESPDESCHRYLKEKKEEGSSSGSDGSGEE